jgi:hypothetical protein
VLKFHSTKSVTTVQQGFWRKFHKNRPCANSVHYLRLSRHFTATLIVVLWVNYLKVTSILLNATEIFWSYPSSGVSFVSEHRLVFIICFEVSQIVCVYPVHWKETDLDILYKLQNLFSRPQFESALCYIFIVLCAKDTILLYCIREH